MGTEKTNLGRGINRLKKYANFKIILESKTSNNYLVTIGIGEKYYNPWEAAALPTWKKYCEKNDIGIIAFFNDLIPENHFSWKKATWQKLMIGTVLEENNIQVENICYLDTDILINPFAPNIFDNYDEKAIAVVSLENNMPMPLDEMKRRLVYLRHTHYSKDYPLDSTVLLPIEEEYRLSGLEPKEDLFCAGLFLFNIKNHSKLMQEWFNKYPKDVQSITGGGDQTHLNYEFLTWGNISWLDYRFQAIWVYEMAWRYPFLYNYGKNNAELIRESIEASLYSNYFLHFAGSWYESDMWKIGGFFESEQKEQELSKYYEYLKVPIVGTPKGTLKP